MGEAKIENGSSLWHGFLVMGDLKEEEGHMQICFVFPIAHNPSTLFPFFFSFVTNRRKL